MPKFQLEWITTAERQRICESGTAAEKNLLAALVHVESYVDWFCDEADVTGAKFFPESRAKPQTTKLAY